ncbi:MAG: homoserine acetyltransferase [Idiomarinaceae bacterium]|nr:homoserine acetyltransferase [Idiomarinaceae bacterium]
MVFPVGRSFYTQTPYGRVKGFCFGNSDAKPEHTIIVQGGISASGQLWRLDGHGWWQSLHPLFAPHPELQVISLDYLGGVGGSDTPEEPITLSQHVEAYASVLRSLGLTQPGAWLGGSFGGVLGLQLVQDGLIKPDALVVIGAAHQPSVQSAALRLFQQALLQQADCSQQGVVLARALAMLTYRSADEFEQRFNDGDEAFSYLLAQGEKLLKRHGQHAQSLFTHLTPILNEYRIDPSRVTVPVQLVGFESDIIAPPRLMHQLEAALPDCRGLALIDTPFGHDGFIKNVADYAAVVRHFLPQLETTRGAQSPLTEDIL